MLFRSEAGGLTLSISISMNARPPRHELRISGTEGTLAADLYHGFSWIEKGSVGRSYKVVRPFVASARMGAAAAVNLSGRILRWEPAYPGLRELVAAFYGEVRSGRSGDSVFRDDHALQVARARDALMAIRGSTSRSS